MVAVAHKFVYKCRSCRILFWEQKSATREQVAEVLASACDSAQFAKLTQNKLAISLRHFHACNDETFGIGDLQRVDRVEP